jgi:SAM-dependent methyltransferase
MPFGCASFDVVFFDRTLHHLVVQGILDTAISEAARVLKPGGLLLAFEPNLWNPVGFGIEVARRLGWVQAIRGRDDDVPLSPAHMCELFRRNGCSFRYLPGTFVWRRLPFAAQRAIIAMEPFLLRGFPRFARVLMFVGVKQASTDKTNVRQ